MAEFDRIVFAQNGLEEAVREGIKRIALCDNHFILPFERDMVYYAVGDVQAVFDGECEEYNILCIGFSPKEKTYPEFLKNGAILPRSPRALTFEGGGSYGSYGSYGNTSYRVTTYTLKGSYQLGNSYMFGGSYRFGGSYMFGGSYRFGGSYMLGGSYTLTSGCIFVGGYGINLI